MPARQPRDTNDEEYADVDGSEIPATGDEAACRTVMSSVERIAQRRSRRWRRTARFDTRIADLGIPVYRSQATRRGAIVP